MIFVPARARAEKPAFARPAPARVMAPVPRMMAPMPNFQRTPPHAPTPPHGLVWLRGGVLPRSGTSCPSCRPSYSSLKSAATWHSG